MVYRIYTSRNLADTTKDPDDYIINELGYKHNLDDAKLVANEYIKTQFFHKDTELSENKNGSISATDFCSYGVTIMIIPIVVD